MTFAMMSLLVMSCADGKSDKAVNKISINIDEAIPLQEAALSIEGIVLNDSMSNHFPGFINKVEWIGNSILILDAYKDPGLYLYDSDGVLVNSYTKRGNGPDEFVGLTDLCVLPSSIVLLDTYSTSHRIYLDRNLTFQRKEDAEKQAHHFICESDSAGGVWYDRGNVAYGENKDKLVYVSGGSRESVLPVPKEIENVTFGSINVFARTSTDTILYLPVVEPRIYKCYGGEAEILCELDFHGMWPDFSGMLDSHPMEMMRRVTDEGKIYNSSIVSDGDDVAVSFYCKDGAYVMKFRYDAPSAHKLFKVDKNTQESIGSVVAIKDGCLVFGVPGKLLKIRVD